MTEEMTVPARVLRLICWEKCKIGGGQQDRHATCGLCRLHEFTRALQFVQEDGLTPEKAVKKAEQEYNRAPASPDKVKYGRAFPTHEG